MAQRVFWNYQEALNSFDFGKMMLGIFFPGRYVGFDTKSFSSMNLSLTHAGTGIQQSDAAGVLTAKTGVWISPQGAVIQENATVVIGAIAANSSGNPRIDLILGDYLKPGSSSAAATYAVVTGTPGASPVAPANPDPTRKVILGTLLVPNGTTTDLTSCTFTKADSPLLAGEARPVWSTSTEYALQNSWKTITDGTDITIKANSVATRSFQFVDHVKNQSGSNAATIVTLPADLRPTEDLYFPVSCSDIGGGAFYLAQLYIRTNGEVRVIMPATATLPGNGTMHLQVYLRHLIIPVG